MGPRMGVYPDGWDREPEVRHNKLGMVEDERPRQSHVLVRGVGLRLSLLIKRKPSCRLKRAQKDYSQQVGQGQIRRAIY